MPPLISRRNLADGSLKEEVYAPVYFGGGTDPQRAQKVSVGPGSNLSVELSFAGARTQSFHEQPRGGPRGRGLLTVSGWDAVTQVRMVSADRVDRAEEEAAA